MLLAVDGVKYALTWVEVEVAFESYRPALGQQRTQSHRRAVRSGWISADSGHPDRLCRVRNLFTYIHTYIHTCTVPIWRHYTHVLIHISCTFMHIHICSYSHDHIHAYIHTYIHTCFHSLVIQFGYTVLFVAAFPLAPTMAFISSYIQIRIDGWKLCQAFRRPQVTLGQCVHTFIHTYITWLFVNTCMYTVCMRALF